MIAGIIPARFASTRFPGKPLIEIQGKSMIQRVYEQAAKSKVLSTVVVATDDEISSTLNCRYAFVIVAPFGMFTPMKRIPTT